MQKPHSNLSIKPAKYKGCEGLIHLKTKMSDKLKRDTHGKKVMTEELMGELSSTTITNPRLFYFGIYIHPRIHIELPILKKNEP